MDADSIRCKFTWTKHLIRINFIMFFIFMCTLCFFISFSDITSQSRRRDIRIQSRVWLVRCFTIYETVNLSVPLSQPETQWMKVLTCGSGMFSWSLKIRNWWKISFSGTQVTTMWCKHAQKECIYSNERERPSDQVFTSLIFFYRTGYQTFTTPLNPTKNSFRSGHTVSIELFTCLHSFIDLVMYLACSVHQYKIYLFCLQKINE